MPTRTATQKRAQAKVEYEAFLAQCPSRQLLDRISDKWVALAPLMSHVPCGAWVRM